MRDRIYMGRIHHYLLYDENSWNQKKKVDLLFVFVCWMHLYDLSVIIDHNTCHDCNNEDRVDCDEYRNQFANESHCDNIAGKNLGCFGSF